MATRTGTHIPPPEERFHANIVKMTSLIRGIVERANKAGYDHVTPFLIDVASNYLNNNFDKVQLIEGFIRQSHPLDKDGHIDHSLWDKIRSRDEEFFREKAFDIFKSLPVDAVNAFKNLSLYRDPKTGQSIIKPEERDEIIDYFHSFVKISIKYIHAKRQPYLVDNKYIYRNPSYLRGIDVLSHAKKWQIQLEFTRQ